MSEKIPEERVYFALPNSFNMVPQEEMTSAMVEMGRFLSAHPEVKIGVENYLSNLSIAAARNHHFWMAVEQKCEWLWFLDSDHRFPPGCFNELYDSAIYLRAHHEKFLCVGGLYYGRTWNHPPMGLDHSILKEKLEAPWRDPKTPYETWRSIINESGKNLFETTTVATGFMLVNVPRALALFNDLVKERNLLIQDIAKLSSKESLDKIDSIKDPQLRFGEFVGFCADLLNKGLAYQAHLPALFVGQYNHRGELVTTEDYYFTYNASTHGYKCFINTDAEVQHMLRELWYPKSRQDEPTPRPPKGLSMEVAGLNTEGLVVPRDERMETLLKKGETGFNVR